MLTMQKRFLLGMISGTGSVAIKTLINILLIPVLIYTLGAEMYGLYILLIGIVELSLVLDLGFASAIAKVLGTYRSTNQTHNIHLMLKMGHVLYAGLTLALLVVGLILIPHFPPLFHVPQQLTGVAEVALVIILIEAALTLYTAYYRAVLLAHCLHQWTHLSETLFILIGNTAGLGLLLCGFGLPALLLARLGAAILRSAIVIYQALKAEPVALFPPAPLNRKAITEIFNLSFHSMMVNFSVLISHKIDGYVIAYFLPLQGVGVFEIVFRFLAICQQVGSKLCEGVFPLFTHFLSTGKSVEARHLFLRMSCVSCFVVSLLLLYVVCFYNPLFQIFSAGKIPIQQTYPILAAAVPCVLSGTMQLPAGYYLFNAGKQWFLSSTSIVAALCNLVLSILLVQSMGLVGVALGTLIPQLLQHQLGLVQKACNGLNIRFWEYVHWVYLRNLPALLGAYLWIQLLQPLIPHGSASLITIGLISTSATLVAATLWLLVSATEQEKAFVSQKILLPLRQKSQPRVGGVNG